MQLMGPEFKCRSLAPYPVWSMDQQHWLVRNTASQTPPDFLNQSLHFTKIPGGFTWALKFEKHGSRLHCSSESFSRMGSLPHAGLNPILPQIVSRRPCF